MSKKLAIVTGTSRGLGYSIAEQLLDCGWVVYGFARSASLLQHERYHHVPMDLSDRLEVENYFNSEFLKIIRPEAWQQIALVNNVGQLDPIAAIQDIDFAELEQSFQLNTVLPIWLMGFCRRVWPSKQLTVVNISSGAATKPYLGWGAYCSTKAALRMAGQVFAAEQAARKQPAAVYAYAPGVLDTSMQSKVRGSDPSVFADLPRFKSLYEQGELIHPDLPARHIVSLIDKSDDRQSGFFELRFERDEHA